LEHLLVNTPEFSLIVTTYNSSRTIDQTLKSLENLEDAGKLEIIISDDASCDDTVERITLWVQSHQTMFYRILVLTREVNQGISANHTRAFRRATAEFGTYLGGDDYFVRPDFFRNVRRFIGPDLKIAKTDLLSGYDETGDVVQTFHEAAKFFSYPLAMQKRLMCLVGNVITGGPGTILHIPTLKRLGYFGENIRSFEDFQVYLLFLFAGYRIRMLPVQGIVWRRHEGSLSYSQKDRLHQEDRRIYEGYIQPFLRCLPFWTRRLTEFRYTAPLGVWVKLLCPLWWGRLLRAFCLRNLRHADGYRSISGCG